MINRVFILLTVLSIVSCGVVSKGEIPNGMYSVQLHGTVHHPYCGGAKPDPDVAKGYYESMKLEKFNLYSGKEIKRSNQPVKEVKLDEGGNVTLILAPGDYYLLHVDKLLSTDEFMKKNGPFNNQHYVVKDKSCYEYWMSSPDLVFTVNADTVIEMRKKAKCWVGTNPCLEYIGPPAP
jgi:hypothetical protein